MKQRNLVKVKAKVVGVPLGKTGRLRSFNIKIQSVFFLDMIENRKDRGLLEKDFMREKLF